MLEHMFLYPADSNELRKMNVGSEGLGKLKKLFEAGHEECAACSHRSDLFMFDR